MVLSNLGKVPFVLFLKSGLQYHWQRIRHQSFYELRMRQFADLVVCETKGLFVVRGKARNPRLLTNEAIPQLGK